MDPRALPCQGAWLTVTRALRICCETSPRSVTVSAKCSRTRPRPARRTWSTRQRIVAGGLGAASVGVLLTAYAVQRPIAGAPPLRFVPVTSEEGFEGFPAWSPDAQTLAYAAAVDGVLQIFTRRLSAPSAAVVTHAGVRLQISLLVGRREAPVLRVAREGPRRHLVRRCGRGHASGRDRRCDARRDRSGRSCAGLSPGRAAWRCRRCRGCLCRFADDCRATATHRTGSAAARRMAHSHSRRTVGRSGLPPFRGPLGSRRRSADGSSGRCQSIRTRLAGDG